MKEKYIVLYIKLHHFNPKAYSGIILTLFNFLNITFNYLSWNLSNFSILSFLYFSEIFRFGSGPGFLFLNLRNISYFLRISSGFQDEGG